MKTLWAPIKMQLNLSVEGGMSLACGESSSRSWRLIRIEASSGKVALVETASSGHGRRSARGVSWHRTQHLLIKALVLPYDIMQAEQRRFTPIRLSRNTKSIFFHRPNSKHRIESFPFVSAHCRGKTGRKLFDEVRHR